MDSARAFAYLSAVQQTYDLLIHVAPLVYIKMCSTRCHIPGEGRSPAEWARSTSSARGALRSPCPYRRLCLLTRVSCVGRTAWVEQPHCCLLSQQPGIVLLTETPMDLRWTRHEEPGRGEHV